MAEHQANDCIFCKIINREAPAAIIHEDEQIIVFADAFPSSQGHSLVVTKAHGRDIHETSEEDLQAVAVMAKRISQAQKTALSPDGIMIAQFNGAAAGQTVFHYHTHVVPRREGEKLTIHGRKQAAPEELEAMAAKLRAVL